ncbi:MAG: cyclodeaminase/cyclohydrolase family protein [Euryarchaeota archaeon]|jgi:formiminotetrahydrofolate cyclodeaminase|nr:cyclodeaminase/cyclohydrolase family protein [Euryarchaeota archaeon]MBT5594766.1 cyclodeaminase/cyclohydrolase family protein [Euryarchaeota archaeon]MBT5844045.1 cyclodeaminase/cyclohydrolase family protein [Euryarchaeota archaeon]MBT6641359.1 cyclodeaminase/cyclohydrolase family protein [Euryarchaeota archaeon]MBT6844596.1 cyclodeaminase/cyclohydrolase family protein [Euryarchaeota archaeon]
MKWMDMTLGDFQDALSSSDPTPGGGTAAAVALGQAAALTRMVAQLTLGKEKWVDGWTDAEKANSIVDTIYHRAGELAQLDSDAFDEVMSSFRMPKSTDEETNNRRNAIRNATLTASEVPFETVTLGMELLNCQEALAQRGNGNAVSDVGVAALLTSAAIKGALFNVEINLQSLPEEMGEEMRQKIPEMRKLCSEVSRKIMHAVHGRMA